MKMLFCYQWDWLDQEQKAAGGARPSAKEPD